VLAHSFEKSSNVRTCEKLKNYLSTGRMRKRKGFTFPSGNAKRQNRPSGTSTKGTKGEGEEAQKMELCLSGAREHPQGQLVRVCAPVVQGKHQ